jgi:hypothetical protein
MMVMIRLPVGLLETADEAFVPVTTAFPPPFPVLEASVDIVEASVDVETSETEVDWPLPPFPPFPPLAFVVARDVVVVSFPPFPPLPPRAVVVVFVNGAMDAEATALLETALPTSVLEAAELEEAELETTNPGPAATAEAARALKVSVMIETYHVPGV